MSKKPCEFFGESIDEWHKYNKEPLFLFCPRENKCFYEHKLPGFSTRFFFSRNAIDEMVSRCQSELERRQNERNQTARNETGPLITATQDS